MTNAVTETNTMKLDEVHSKILESPSGLYIWWVDDCFTNKEAEKDGGGMIPFGRIRDLSNGDKYLDEILSPRSGNENEQAGRILYDVCKEEEIGLHICSFEYAESHFPELNSKENAVLLDLGYAGQPNEDVYGAKLYEKKIKAESRDSKAVFSFLTTRADRSLKWVKNQATWMPDVPYTIQKGYSANSRSRLVSELREVIKYIRERRPSRISQLSLSEWIEIKNSAYRQVKEVHPDESWKWVHHLPQGGDHESNEHKAMFDTVVERLVSEFSVLKGLQKYPWTLNHDYLSPWNCPPIRALCQLDRLGEDLSTAFHLLNLRLGEDNRIYSNICTESFKFDYLWFNASALLQGLFLLASNLPEAVTEDISNSRVCGKPIFSVSIKEEASPDSEVYAEPGAIAIQIKQPYLVRQEGEERKIEGISTKRLPVPDPADENRVRGRVKTAYDCFRRAGANEFSVDDDGTLRFKIGSKVMEDNETWIVQQ